MIRIDRLQHNKPETTFNFVSVNEVYIDNVINKLKNPAIDMIQYLISI